MNHKQLSHNIFGEYDEFAYNSESLCPRAKFKGAPGPPSSKLPDTGTMAATRKKIYPTAVSAMEGRGFGTPEFMGMQKRNLYQSLDDAYATASGDLQSQMHRMVRSGDARTKSYVTDSLSREYVTKQDDIARGLRQEKVADQDLGMAMSAGYLASEKRMGIDTASAYNRALQQNAAMQQQMGTFGTNVAGGLGAGVGDYYFAQKMANTNA